MKHRLIIPLVVVITACGPDTEDRSVGAGTTGGEEAETASVQELDCTDSTSWRASPPLYATDAIEDVSHGTAQAAVEQALEPYVEDGDELRIEGAKGVLVRDGRDVVVAEASETGSGDFLQGAIFGCSDVPRTPQS